MLLRKGALIFNKSERMLDMSSFFIALNSQKIWAIEMFCDFGANVDTKSSAGCSPLFHTAYHGYDDMCMYLSLRCKDIDMEDENGKTILLIYLLRKDIDRMKQLLIRGVDINHACKAKKWTPLHWAIENKLSSKVIKFLLRNGANPHIEDDKGKDCCDKAILVHRYQDIKLFHQKECARDPSLRITSKQLMLKQSLRQNMAEKVNDEFNKNYKALSPLRMFKC